MERQGSGFKKITDAYYAAHNYRDELKPKFYSDVSSFQVTLYNLNYGADEKVAFDDENVAIEDEKQLFDEQKTVVSDEKQLFGEQKTVVSDENRLFETLLLGLKAKTTTKETLVKLYRKFGFDMAFARADIMKLVGITSSPAGALIDKLKGSGLIEPVVGQGKGKYKFVMPKS